MYCACKLMLCPHFAECTAFYFVCRLLPDYCLVALSSLFYFSSHLLFPTHSFRNNKCKSSVCCQPGSHTLCSFSFVSFVWPEFMKKTMDFHLITWLHIFLLAKRKQNKNKKCFVQSSKLEVIDFYRMGCKMHSYCISCMKCTTKRMRECTSNECETKWLAAAAATASSVVCKWTFGFV